MKIYLLIIFSFLLLIVNAQVEDHFDDGDFTNSPTWYGDTADFIVNIAGQLQLNASIGGNSFLSLAANLTSLDTVEWRFWVHLNFSPSSSNYARVYLSADQSNWQQPLNGYFIQFGEALSNDAIELFRQDGTTTTSICRGQDGMIANAFSTGVKVLRNSNGDWTLFADYSGGDNYMIEATGHDTIYQNAGWVGVNCVYTSGNINKFYFDDFYAGHEIHDTILPFATQVNDESDSVLSISFSEKMDDSSINMLSNYFVDNGIGHPDFIFPDSLNALNYLLHFSTGFLPGINYTISISGLKDLSQNQMVNQVKSFSFYPVVTAQIKDVVFSEIYFEPVSLSPLPNSEYVEIYNRRDSTIVISGWMISDGTSDGLISAFRLKPNDFVVLFAENDSAKFISIPNALAVRSFPTLNNDVGDHLILSDENGNLIDEIKFDDGYYHDNNKNDGGWSIERIDPDFTCNDEENWKASTSNSHGTPGIMNSVNGVFSDKTSPFIKNAFIKDSLTLTIIFSEEISDGISDINNYRIEGIDGIEINPMSVFILSDDTVELNMPVPCLKIVYTLQVSSMVKDCAGNSFETLHRVKFGFPGKANPKDILINELLFNSYSGGNDFVELYNRSQKIIDLNKWTIAEVDYDDISVVKENAFVANGNRLLFPGEYLVLSEDEKKVKYFYRCEDDFAFLNVKSMPDFNSDKGRVLLFDDNGNTIDAFRYNSNFHFPLLAETKGISLERLSTEDLNDDSLNWHSAAGTAGFATPGYGNSLRIGLEAGDAEVSVGMEIFSPDNDGYNDVLPIHYSFTQTGTVLSLNVYDLNSRPIRTILSGETVGSEGVLNWDGLKDDRSIANEGIYILLAKSFDLNGNDHEIKMTCFLTRRF